MLGVVESRAVIKWLLITSIMGDCARTPPAPAGRWEQEPRQGLDALFHKWLPAELILLVFPTQFAEGCESAGVLPTSPW